ncbi:MAG: ABC transporter permease, partial [Planctomycetota bacterium]|nr:ABC transporter permease [Planctomycetota bacterium]
GMLLGWAGTEILIKLFSGGLLVASYLPEIFATGFLLAFSVGAAGSVYPALRASSLKPAEALRYE